MFGEMAVVRWKGTSDFSLMGKRHTNWHYWICGYPGVLNIFRREKMLPEGHHIPRFSRTFNLSVMDSGLAPILMCYPRSTEHFSLRLSVFM